MSAMSLRPRDQIGDLVSILKKFRSDELQHSILGMPPDAAKLSRNTLIDKAVLNMAETGRDLKQFVAQLDLLHIQLHSQRKFWHVLHVKDVPEVESLDVDNFESQLQRELRSRTEDVQTICQVLDDEVWCRVHLQRSAAARRSRKKQSHVFYLVIFPGISYVAVANLKPSLKERVLNAVQVALGGRDITMLSLSSHSYIAAIRYALQKEGRLVEESLPVGLQRPVREESISDEDDEEQISRKRWLDNKFGPCEQPDIEQFVVQTRSRYGDEALDLGRDHVVECTIQLTGSNVMEGLYRLACKGVVECPLVPHLAKLPRHGNNKIVLKERRTAAE